MAEKEELESVEETLNQKLKMKRKLGDALGVTYTTVGRHYPKLRQNIAEQFWIWFHDNKGWRAVGTGLGIFFGLILAYFDFPQLLLVIVSTPVLWIVGEIGAKLIMRKKLKKIKSLQFEKKATPYSVSYDEVNQKVESVLLESKITGFHDYTVFDEAITDTPKPGSIQMVGANTARDYITNQEGLFVEYVSDDGMFAAGNPFTGFGNYALLESYQNPKYFIAKKYQKVLDSLDSLKKVDPARIDNIKVLNAHFRRQIKAAENTASAIQKMVTDLTLLGVRKIGTIDVQTDRFLTHLDEWKTPWFKKYSEYMKIPETTRLPPLIDQMNQASSLNNLAMSMKIAHTKLFDKARMAHYEADIKIQKQTIDQIIQTADTDSKKLESPVSIELQKEVLRVNNQITDEPDEEDEW